MKFATPRRTRAVFAALAVLVVAGVIDGTLLWRRAHWNAVIRGEQTIPRSGELPAEVRFAEAAALAASGAGEEALHRWRALQGVSPLGQAARVNAANLLMRQAIEVRAGPQPGTSVPLIELAKENYRDVLRHDPGQWDARYNLERAQRLLPDPEQADADAAEAPPGAERAATTMRGYSPGLP